MSSLSLYLLYLNLYVHLNFIWGSSVCQHFCDMFWSLLTLLLSLFTNLWYFNLHAHLNFSLSSWVCQHFCDIFWSLCSLLLGLSTNLGYLNFFVHLNCSFWVHRFCQHSSLWYFIVVCSICSHVCRQIYKTWAFVFI